MNQFSKLGPNASLPDLLVWKQPRFGAYYYELVDDKAGDALYATLTWPKWLSDLAVARSPLGTWYFDRLGWLRGTVVATQPRMSSASSDETDSAAPVQIASFEIGWLWEGDLVMSGGSVFHWYRTGTFRNTWSLAEVIQAEHSRPENNPSSSDRNGSQEKPAKTRPKRKKFRLGRQPKPARRERLVYQIEFGMHWFKEQAWIERPATLTANDTGLIFLLCAGMYLGHCYNQDSAGAVAASSIAAVS